MTQQSVAPATAGEADVIVVGAGPAGSATAYYLAQAGLQVLLLEKTQFPREKVCGDGLTPRAVKQLVGMGIDVSKKAGWLHNKGLRIVSGGQQLEVAWPELASFPDYGLVRPRADFDQLLAQRAVAAGVQLHQRTSVTGPITDDRSGRIVGVTAKAVDEAGRTVGDEVSYKARLVVAADGNSTRLSLAMGLHKRDDRPLGVAMRTYYRNPADHDDWLETWLELDDGERLLPGYGWIFGMGDGTSNVGIGLLSSAEEFRGVDQRQLLERWLNQLSPERGFVPENMTQPVRGAALPMGFNRQPHYTRGLLLVGDAGGMVNPFNGEGIAYAMESGAIAAEVIAAALARETSSQREQELLTYPRILKDTYGGYYTIGRYFVKLISEPRVMRLATQRGLSHERAMKVVLKLLANLTDPRGGDTTDRVLNALAKVAPAA
ncbi:MAG: geranylgeranyl reductase family protein [Candidatus Nanopelagicales bacterium]